ncbi:tRNA (adenosine(37)-N6)-threonylcarbamoyltransferase complex transferase subunit TsaD [Candidatus Beckwithbacteria bacterium CG10_big_fil_rev_8_21_14_0_10_34_10]|uniref:tRNA N6-adenosine threonylcarbamoyltransferase n=1 Tax=Candidatus Beckwithbacteria bacterium CG10_big_fil_rev_8_21_14_0_10_34_10 TaxID=1974495 RepID=A0A2H0WA66_9BACT|nr:MAG: tRNA (adenosine(37)-N6)-threonylcarbamoyltransferase complex transferase subunit TsaD [Candidatus Beckwithbacteria bacterium CG10_big_fil_rev_8_21_14_0_10_34_10]
MKILGIESSCDETGAAILEKDNQGKITILSSVISSSASIQKKYGGIIPEKAAREQIKAIIPIISESLNQAGVKPQELTAIAVTKGPGLIGSLLIGLETAKTLSLVWGKPLIPINHLQAHLYANFVENNNISFPALGLIVSGGHTELVLMKNSKSFKLISQTRDDAAGECFDKSARLLGFSYPGGPEIEKASQKVSSEDLKKSELSLPRPLFYEKTLDFSFSGLKTAVLYQVKGKKLSQKQKNIYAFELQKAISEVLVKKTKLAADKYKVKSILIGGGVAANLFLRKSLKKEFEKIKLFIPKLEFCQDNGIIIAAATFFKFKPALIAKIRPDPSLKINE